MSIPPLPLPTVEQARLFEKAARSTVHTTESDSSRLLNDRVLILGTGSNDVVSGNWNTAQQTLLSEIATAIQHSKILAQSAVLVGSCAHGRAPPGEYADCAHRRNLVLDNIVQEELAVKSHEHGKVPFVAITYSDVSEEHGYGFTPGKMTLHVSRYIQTPFGVLPSDLDIANPDLVTQIPDVACVIASIPGETGKGLSSDCEPTRYQGIKSLPETALSFGGWMRASALSCDREPGTNHTIALPTTAEDIHALTKLPHKPGVVMVRPAAGVIEGILVPHPDLLSRYRPEGVPEDLWEQLVAVSPGNLTASVIPEYAGLVVSALEHVVLAIVAKRSVERKV